MSHFQTAGWRSLLINLIITATLVVLSARAVNAQQMIVDDAETAGFHVIETWLGTEESWIQPSISLLPSWDLSPGIIFASSDADLIATNWLIETKYVPDSFALGSWKIGNVSAVVFDIDGGLSQVYSYLPLSTSILNETALLHLNVGTEFNKFDQWEGSFTSGIRGDFLLSGRVALLTEFFTYDFRDPRFQAGPRIVLFRGTLEMDITYGRGFQKNQTYPGFNVGISYSPGF